LPLTLQSFAGFCYGRSTQGKFAFDACSFINGRLGEADGAKAQVAATGKRYLTRTPKAQLIKPKIKGGAHQ